MGVSKMKKEQIANRNGRQYAEGKIDFQGSNTFGEWYGSCYAVYSYGYHFPIFAFVQQQGWFENTDKYSISTSKHQSQMKPNVSRTKKVDTKPLKDIIWKYGGK